MQKVYIVNTGLANLASVSTAFSRIGTSPVVTDKGADITKARYLVLPGVGSFGAAIKKLNHDNLIDRLRERYQSGKSTLSICLGFQLLAGKSEESNESIGLGLIKSNVIKMRSILPIPQIGWNKVIPDSDCSMIEPGYAYFANSYAYAEMDEGWQKSYFDYENKYIAAIEKGNLLACQFHPELSGEYGSKLLQQWIKQGTSR